MGHKSKKSKSHKSSSSKKSKKEKKDRKEDRRVECPLGDALTKALLSCPRLLEEIPQMMTALDKGEYINIDAISNVSMRDSLNDVFSHVPILSKDKDGHGWYRNVKDKKIASYILNSLSESKVIRDPRKLDSGQSQASRIPPLQLLALVEKFPNISNELPIIIDQILDGNAVQLEQISDEELGEAIEKLLKSLGLVQTRDGLDVPKDKREANHVINCLEHFEEIFKSYTRGRDRCEIDNGENFNYDSESSSSSGESKNGSVSTASSSSQKKRNHSDDEESESEIGPSVKVAGPNMPTKRELEKAQLLMANFQKINEDEDEDDDFGPRLRDTTNVPDDSFEDEPIGYIGVDRYSNINPSGTLTEESAPQVQAREEWLLTPGESKSIADLIGDPTKMTSRKFQMGKQAKKKAEELQIRNAYLKSVQNEGQNEEPAIVDNRPSLMEEHLAKKSRVEDNGPKVRRPFDREKDVVGHKKLGINEIQQLVENSKELSSRFGKGGVQKNFM